MELFTLISIVDELTDSLKARRLAKAFQFGTTDVVLDFNLHSGERLFISTDPKRLTMHLTRRTNRQFNEEARNDTPFISLLKKYLSHAQLQSIECLVYDRVVRIHLLVEDETGNTVQREVVIHLTGRSANVLILEGSAIIASLREKSVEEIEGGYSEPAPAADKSDPFYCTAEKLDELIAANEGDVMAAAHLNLIGFGLQYATELAFRAQSQTPHEALTQLLETIFHDTRTPLLYTSAPLTVMQSEAGREQYKLAFAPIVMRHLQHLEQTPFTTVNQAADAYFSLLDRHRSFIRDKQLIESQLKTKLKKQESLEKNLLREKANFAESETWQRYGELLLSNLHQAEMQGSSIKVVDFFDPDQSTLLIPSANKGTPQEAAEHYFRLARKARKGIQTINARLPEITAQIASLNALLNRISSTIHADKLAEISQEIGITATSDKQKSPVVNKKGRAEKLSGVRRYRSVDGMDILVGRTSRDNDQLTMRIAKSNDLWFHTADYPGSHVILRNPKRSVIPNSSLIQAAQLAAKFSQANNTSGAKVAVNYCEKKFVTKPKGFAPGQVRLSSYKTILVEPGETAERVY